MCPIPNYARNTNQMNASNERQIFSTIIYMLEALICLQRIDHFVVMSFIFKISAFQKSERKGNGRYIFEHRANLTNKRQF